MKMADRGWAYYLGEEGTEQFTVETRVDGETIKIQPIHDPFIHNTTFVGLSRWQHFKMLLKPKHIKVEVTVRASEGAQRAIMTLNPFQLQEETASILHERQRQYESFVGECVDAGQNRMLP